MLRTERQGLLWTREPTSAASGPSEAKGSTFLMARPPVDQVVHHVTHSSAAGNP